MESGYKYGQKLGKYRILELIGHGGMASVFLGVDETLDRKVAIKVLHPHLESRKEARERFRREARAIAKISHPNIVEIYEYGGDVSGQSYIVTQFIKGGSLQEIKEKFAQLPPELVASIAIQIATGLEFAHSRNIIHRDVKPENILLDEDGTVKIADFGIAHLADAKNLTTTGQILGSPCYMSPEQVEGGPLDERTDIFSFGSLTYYLATGRNAFDGANPHLILRNIVEKKIESVERIAPAMGRALSKIILKCMEKLPEKRYDSFKPVIEELKQYLMTSDVSDPQKEVKEFIHSPEQYLEQRKEKSIEIWQEKARQFRRAGRLADEVDIYNRILALDPENQDVLRSLKEVRNFQSRTRAIKWFGGVCIIFALLFGGFFVGEKLFSQKWLMTSDRESPKGGLGSVVPPWKRVSSMDDETGANENLTPPEDRVQPEKVKKNTGRKRLKSAVHSGSAKAGKNKYRRVRFVPYPKSVKIYIDGQLIGNYFNNQEMNLKVGLHTIKFEPLDPLCCETAQWTVNVVTGSKDGKPQLIGKRLAFRASTVVVGSTVKGRVLIDGISSGVTGEEIEVQMNQLPYRNVEIAVSARGCSLWTTKKLIRAGRKYFIEATPVCK